MKELDKLNQLGESRGELRRRARWLALAAFFKPLAFPFVWRG